MAGQRPPTGSFECEANGWTRLSGSTFSEAYRDVLCHRLTCEPCSIEASQSAPFTDKETCFDELATLNTLVYSNLSQQLDNPTLFSVDATALDDCLNRIQTCDVPSALEETCPQLDTGRLTEGACCDRRGGCGAGLACVGRTSASTGTCQPRKNAGELCTGDAFVTGDCRVGLRCVRGFCAALIPRDGTCTESFECAHGLVCSAGACRQGQGVGEACGAAACAEGLFCSGGICTPWRDEGERCDSATAFGDSDGGCKLGLFCRDDNETCESLPERGESCVEARACRDAAQNFCNISVDGTEGSGLCQRRHVTGEDCLARIPHMCSPNNLCIGGRCQQALAEPLCP